MPDSFSEFDEIRKEPADPEVEVIPPNEIMREILKSNVLLDSLYAIPPLLLNLSAYGKKDSCSYLGYKGNIIPVVIRRTLGIYALAQHSPPQVDVRIEGARRIDIVENIRVLRSAFPALLVKLRQYPFDDAYLHSSANWIGVPTTDKQDLQIDLTNPVEVIYSRVTRDQRNRLRKALNLNDEGVISSFAESLPPCVREETSPDGVEKLGRLLSHTVRKISSERDKLEPEGVIQSYEREYAAFERSFATLRDYGLVKVFIAYDEREEPGSGAVLLVSREYIRSPMALWWLAGSTPEGNRRGLSAALQWAIITWLIRNGYHRYDLGGIGPEVGRRGPSYFKRSFGGQEVSGHVLWYSPLPFLSELVGRRGT
jgi:hypothetical protein